MRTLDALLRCPKCGSQLTVADSAVCSSAGHCYPAVDGIPVLLDEDAMARDPQYAGQRAYFDCEFGRYEHYSLEDWRVSYLDRLRSAGMLDSSGAPLVDVGVGGSGYTVIEAARSGRDALGCDLSLGGLRVARAFAESEGVADRTSWVCCSAEQLPIASGSAGSALAIAVLEHVRDDIAALRELARILQPGGRLWVTVPHALRHISPVFRPANRRHDRKLGHLRRYDANTLLNEARDAGLEPIEIEFTGHPVKVLQLVPGRLSKRLWWWCERRDRRRANVERGSMQLSIAFARR